jgi:hypothetical protein
MRFPFESSCFLLHNLRMRVRAFWAYTRFMRFPCAFSCFGLFGYFDQVSSAFLSCAFDCECNRPSVVATVFDEASSFNGDLNYWDVATVTDMSFSKSIRIVESDLTGREFMLL